MEAFITAHWLDITTTVLGLAYILFEYRASLWLWPVGLAMQALGIVLYYQKGLYADCGMEFYYICMTVYGFCTWKWGKRSGQKEQEELPITHIPQHLQLQCSGIAQVQWARTGGRQFHHSGEHCGHLGARTQVSGAVAGMDSRRRGNLCALFL